MPSFSAQVDAWTAKSEARITAVFRQSVQDLAEEVQRPVSRGGHMRVDTGFLRASLLASTVAMPRIDPTARPSDGGNYVVTEDIVLTIAGSRPGQTIYLGFTASYAGIREYHDGFVRLAAQRWPQIVARAGASIKARVTARQ